jgi:hypothetical protein
MLRKIKGGVLILAMITKPTLLLLMLIILFFFLASPDNGLTRPYRFYLPHPIMSSKNAENIHPIQTAGTPIIPLLRAYATGTSVFI